MLKNIIELFIKNMFIFFLNLNNNLERIKEDNDDNIQEIVCLLFD
jgi:hypothetical protein